jgi:hypothetical protein
MEAVIGIAEVEVVVAAVVEIQVVEALENLDNTFIFSSKTIGVYFLELKYLQEKYWPVIFKFDY